MFGPGALEMLGGRASISARKHDPAKDDMSIVNVAGMDAGSGQGLTREFLGARVIGTIEGNLRLHHQPASARHSSFRSVFFPKAIGFSSKGCLEVGIAGSCRINHAKYGPHGWIEDDVCRAV
jgi:hypothetical protein